MVGRLVSGIVAVVVTAYLVALFFPWTDGEDGELSVGEVTGLDVSPAFFSFNTGLALLLWELLAVAGVRRTVRADSLVAFFLAAGTAAMGLTALVHIKWGAPLPYTNDLAATALFVLPLSILLLAGAITHLVLHVISSPR